jgi:hypothetical protein
MLETATTTTFQDDRDMIEAQRPMLAHRPLNTDCLASVLISVLDRHEAASNAWQRRRVLGPTAR